MNQQENENEDEIQETSLREDMESAMEEVSERVGDDSGDDYVEKTPEIKEKETESTENVDPLAAGQAGENDSKPGVDSGKPGADDSKPGVDETKAPQSWSPKLREDFAKLPANVQAQISKREGEMSTFLNEGAESRKFGDRMNQTLQPFQSVMAAHGTNDPVQAVQGLMETAAMLQMGSPQQKAQKLADMVQHYGIDITALDNALSGQPQVTAEQSNLEKMLEQKLAPMNQFMNNVQQNQQTSQQQVQETAQNDVGTFEQTAEFINDVRNDMADLLDMAASRNQEMTLQQAYDKACALNPEISGIISQRASDDLLKGNQQSNQNKRYAASSIRGNQVATNTGPVDDSIMGALNQAWDDQGR
jgi:hypothetical protein